HRQYLADRLAVTLRIGRLLAQASGHVAVTLGDQGFEQRWRLLGEFTEHAAEHVAFLEFLDLAFLNLLAGDQAAGEAADDAEALEEGDAADGALEGDADLAIDQPDR